MASSTSATTRMAPRDTTQAFARLAALGIAAENAEVRAVIFLPDAAGATRAEALEFAFPLRVRRYAVRRASGGVGQHAGGDGVVREVEFLTPAHVTVLAERRSTRPYGLSGGGPGQSGKTVLIKDGAEIELAAKTELTVEQGDVLRIETPGGGAWGATSE